MGHFLGLYTHDVGPCVQKKDESGNETEVPQTLAITQNVTLKKSMVLTIEPGIYFHHVLIDKYKNDKDLAHFFNFDQVAEYMSVGGIRIEDDVLVTEDGFENLSIVPRTVEEIEAYMKKE